MHLCKGKSSFKPYTQTSIIQSNRSKEKCKLITCNNDQKTLMKILAGNSTLLKVFSNIFLMEMRPSNCPSKKKSRVIKAEEEEYKDRKKAKASSLDCSVTIKKYLRILFQHTPKLCTLKVCIRNRRL